MVSRKSRSGPVRESSVARAKPFWLMAVVLVVAVWLFFRTAGEPIVGPPPEGPVPAAAAFEPLDFGADEVVFGGYAGSASCRECHLPAFEAWEKSNHGLAERAPNPGMDDGAFHPERTFRHGTETSTALGSNGVYEVVTLGLEGRRGYPVERVIGESPLRQFLVSAPGGRFQTLGTAYDPHKGEWFHVQGDEDRQPGEWGHWTGRGMTWNTMCAGCHNTRLRKNYEPETDSYRTAMAEMSVGCEACHGPMKAHVDWQKEFPGGEGDDPAVKRLEADRVLDTCGSCHSRRSELTGDFKPGDAYGDHYSLLLPDESDIYYPDGQVRGENYVFGSFLGSGMHGAGVRCGDCHEPHSTGTILQGNLLCMRCHNGSYVNSPVIDPAGHSFHKLDGAGGQCVNCHMPQTTYMERHPRRDHGFTIPDPLLTRELGIPNACNRCHADKDVDWSVAAVEKWYGPRMQRRTRERARWIASARAGGRDARDRILTLLDEEKSPYWQAVAAGLLDQWVFDPRVMTALMSVLEHPSPLVRSSAAQSLEPLAQERLPQVEAALRGLLEDPVRSVRVQAAWALRHLPLDSLASRELVHYLDHNADQPAGLLQKGVYHLARREMDAALAHFGRAVEWDPNSAPLRHEYAVVLSMQLRAQEALVQMQAACRLEPEVAEYQYKLALAWNEVGDSDGTEVALERAVVLDPNHARAWYNLGLSRSRSQDFEGALEALVRSESVDGSDPRIPFARATVLARMGRVEEARVAASRALEIRPDFEAARQFLQQQR